VSAGQKISVEYFGINIFDTPHTKNVETAATTATAATAATAATVLRDFYHTYMNLGVLIR